MKTLIAYMSMHGTAKKCAEALSQKINGDVQLVDLKKTSGIDISGFDAVVIGGSIHAGNIQKKVKEFCESNLAKLKEKKVGLYICCLETGDKAVNELNDNFPEELLSQAVIKTPLCGELDFSKYGFILRFIMKKIMKSDQNMSTYSEEKISEFAKAIKV